MKKLVTIFSAIFISAFLQGFPFEVELQLLIARYLKSSQEPVLPRTPQTYIKENKKELLQYFSTNFNPIEPLPFVYCVYPAIFDVVQSHDNKELFEQAFANPCFNPLQVIHRGTASNLFHACSAAGTNKFLKQLLNYCKEHRLNYRSLMNGKNNNGMTPVGLATKYSRTKCVSLLLSHGASLEAQPGSLMHFAASANTRGETKRNAVVQRLCDHDELLVTAVNASKKWADVTAGIFNYTTTAQLITAKKLELFKQLHDDDTLYFQHLPKEIYQLTLAFTFDQQSRAVPQIAQSLPVVLP